MTLKNLSDRELDMLLQSMRSMLVKVRWIDDPEFQTRLGIDRYELAQVIRDWPHVDETAMVTREAVLQTLNEIINGLDIREAEWQKCFDFSRDELKKLFKKLRTEN